MSAFEQYAVQRVLDQAQRLNVEVPAGLPSIVCHSGSNPGARAWAAAHPDDDTPCGCYGYAMNGPEGCNCWEPVYDLEQADPRPPAHPEDLRAQPRMCGDCAYRPGSPERSVPFEEEALLNLAYDGTPFWCHAGMRRPASWRHPDGRTVPGDSADYQPPMIGGIPYQADGSPGLLCGGWAAIAAKALEDGTDGDA